MLWMILTTKKTSNRIPYWGIRPDLHPNTKMEIICLMLRRKPSKSFQRPQAGTGEYDHMELIDYIDVPSIPDYWITSRLNEAFKGHASIWYTEMKEIHGRRNWPWCKCQIIQKCRNATWIWKKTKSFDNDKYSVDIHPY
ncbi:hypothetical protein O181_051418 [Austropuccinia psidii MF-1]|uniref:Uncharacterized protein n=1 Tax=Austropuccinia psidii MF-1 TaxID=1389203 RepID=A0A9Q3HNC2_9BASI|nr:hypothetical protein [Austropuccinia psidii MF-1]